LFYRNRVDGYDKTTFIRLDGDLLSGFCFCLIYATADEADAYMFYICFFLFFFVFFPFATKYQTTVLENG